MPKAWESSFGSRRVVNGQSSFVCIGNVAIMLSGLLVNLVLHRQRADQVGIKSESLICINARKTQASVIQM
jgi:hypothetical protein